MKSSYFGMTWNLRLRDVAQRLPNLEEINFHDLITHIYYSQYRLSITYVKIWDQKAGII